VAGTLGLYFTNSLYEDDEPVPAASRGGPPDEGVRLRSRFGSHTSLASDDGDAERLPLRCAQPSRPAAGACRRGAD
jgi:hypothetical protein